MTQYQLLINGQLVRPEGDKYFESINPSTGKPCAQIPDASKAQMQSAIEAARNAFDSGAWSSLPIEERGKYLKKIADAIRDNAKELADLESEGTGKTIKHATFIDVPTCADTFEYFSKAVNALDEKLNPVDAPVKSVTQREPMGVVGCIIPWNYPLIMTAWKLGPALITGNTIVLKPSSAANVSILKLAEIIAKVGLPKGVVNIVSTKQHEVGSLLVESPLTDMFGFIGGTETGEKVMGAAAKTTKKITLELGGKSPNIVFADCDFDAALGGTLSGIFINQGQMCTAGSRLFLEDKIYDKFIDALVKKTKNIKIGNSADYATEFGPLVNKRHRDYVLKCVEEGKLQGAKLLCGGKIPDGDEFKNGAYIEPAIFCDVTNGMKIAQEEIFGPVLAVIKFSNEEDAIKQANDTKYGLAATIWTKDLDKANNVAKRLQCGTVWINTYGGFYNEAPFGGYKRSGFGRELGEEGLLEYTQTKHVCIDQTPGGRPLVASWF